MSASPSAFVSGFLAALPLHLVRPAAGRSRALPPSTRLPSVAAVLGVSGCRPALQHLCPAFSRPCRCIWRVQAASHSRHSRRPPISQHRCCPWGIGVSASPSALVSSFLGSLASASDAPGQPAPFARLCTNLFFRQLCRRKNSSRGLRGRAKAVPGEFARGTAIPFAPFRTGSKTAGRCRRTAAGRRCCSGA